MGEFLRSESDAVDSILENVFVALHLVNQEKPPCTHDLGHSFVEVPTVLGRDVRAQVEAAPLKDPAQILVRAVPFVHVPEGLQVRRSEESDPQVREVLPEFLEEPRPVHDLMGVLVLVRVHVGAHKTKVVLKLGRIFWGKEDVRITGRQGRDQSARAAVLSVL